MKRVYTGKESQGKNYILADFTVDVISRNKKWLKKTGYPRTLAFDKSSGSENIKNLCLNAGLKYVEFENLTDILYLTEADIFIGELLKFFPARGSDPLSNEQLDFLTEGAKSGVFMYCASQDFSQVHKQFRILVNEVFIVTKLIGSNRPIKSRPNSKYVWGIIMARQVNPDTFKGDNVTMEEESFTFPQIYFLKRSVTDLFNTNLKVPLTEHPPKYLRRQKLIAIDKDKNIVYEKEQWR